MEYILTEILKNSFRATVEHHCKRHNDHPSTSPAHPHLYPQSQSQPQTQHPLPPVLITIAPPPRFPGLTKPATLSLRIRDQGGGVPPSNMARIFSYAFTTAGRGACGSSSRHGYGRRHDNNDRNAETDEGTGVGGGPYAAQYIGGAAAVGSDMGALDGVALFGEITGKGVQTGLGTIAGLGFGLPMSRLYAQ
jgi:26S proteasome regulatory subunit T1